MAGSVLLYLIFWPCEMRNVLISSSKTEAQVWTKQRWDEAVRGAAATASGFSSCCSRTVAYLQGDDGTETELIQQTMNNIYSYFILYNSKFSLVKRKISFKISKIY